MRYLVDRNRSPVRLADEPGCIRETDHEAVMERVDGEGKILGFSIMRVSQFSKGIPVQAELV